MICGTGLCFAIIRILLEHLAMMLLTRVWNFQTGEIFLFLLIHSKVSKSCNTYQPKANCTSPKTNMDTQNDGLETVTPLTYGHFWYLSIYVTVDFWGVDMWFWSWNLWKSQFRTVTGSVRVPKGIMAMEGVAAREITRGPKIVHQWLTTRCVFLHPDWYHGITIRPSGRAVKQLQEKMSYRSTIYTYIYTPCI